VSFVFDLSFSELSRVQKNLLSGAKTLFRHAEISALPVQRREKPRKGAYRKLPEAMCSKYKNLSGWIQRSVL
jgi:hypothetical protein